MNASNNDTVGAYTPTAIPNLLVSFQTEIGIIQYIRFRFSRKQKSIDALALVLYNYLCLVFYSERMDIDK